MDNFPHIYLDFRLLISRKTVAVFFSKMLLEDVNISSWSWNLTERAYLHILDFEPKCSKSFIECKEIYHTTLLRNPNAAFLSEAESYGVDYRVYLHPDNERLRAMSAVPAERFTVTPEWRIARREIAEYMRNHRPRKV